MNKSLAVLVTFPLLVLAAGCCSLKSRASNQEEAAYSLIHLSGQVTAMPDPKNWPGALRIGSKVDLWATVNNKSPDVAPGDMAKGLYQLDDIPEAWKIKIIGVTEFGYARSTTSPFLSVGTTPGSSGYTFESGFITSPPALPNHQSLLVTAKLLSGQPILTTDKLPVTEIPLASFDQLQSIQIRATNRASGLVEIIRAKVSKFEVFQASREKLAELLP